MRARHSLNVRACLGEPYEFQIEVHHINEYFLRLDSIESQLRVKAKGHDAFRKKENEILHKTICADFDAQAVFYKLRAAAWQARLKAVA